MSLGSNRQRLSTEFQQDQMFHRTEMRLLFSICDWSLLHRIVKRHRGYEKGLLKVAPEIKGIPYIHIYNTFRLSS
jgi:hypothetical protein